MLIDRTHRGWIVGCLIALLIATAIYIPYSRASLHGPTGGSVLGLTYGILGFALMIFAGLLGAPPQGAHVAPGTRGHVDAGSHLARAPELPADPVPRRLPLRRRR